MPLNSCQWGCPGMPARPPKQPNIFKCRFQKPIKTRLKHKTRSHHASTSNDKCIVIVMSNQVELTPLRPSAMGPMRAGRFAIHKSDQPRVLVVHILRQARGTRPSRRRHFDPTCPKSSLMSMRDICVSRRDEALPDQKSD